MTAALPSPAFDATFREQLLAIDPLARDAWVNTTLALADVPDDAHDLPPGCVPYVPCSVDVLLDAIDRAGITSADTFVDVGAGVGRALTLVRLLSGTRGVGLEVQAHLVEHARSEHARLGLTDIRVLHGDAATLVSRVDDGTVFFFYCPFGRERMAHVLDALRPLARERPLRFCFVDMPVPALPWLVEVPPKPGDRDSLRVMRTAL